MDKDRIEASTAAAKDSLKEAIAKIIGSETTHAEGAARKSKREAQDAAGKNKDAPREKPKK